MTTQNPGLKPHVHLVTFSMCSLLPPEGHRFSEDGFCMCKMQTDAVRSCHADEMLYNLCEELVTARRRRLRRAPCALPGL